MIIDKLAYNSRLRGISAIEKLLLSMTALIICISANSFTVSAFTALTMLIFIICIGKTSAKNVLHLMTIPIVFIIAGSAAIALSIGNNNSLMVCAFKIGDTYIGVGRNGLLVSLKTIVKCFGAVSCMYFLSLTTPMTDLFTLLRRSIIPNFIVEIAELIYRYIFVLFDAADRMYTAQASRLGYGTLKTSYRSTAALASNLFIRAFKQAQRTYTAMEARGYDGDISVLTEQKRLNPRFIIFAAVYILILTVLAILCRKAGI